MSDSAPSEIITRNPATGETLAHYAYHTEAETEAILRRADVAFERHRATTFAERAQSMQHLADGLDEQKRDLGALMTREMGKPLAQAVAEAEKCATVCRYYAERAEAHLADEPVETEASKSMIVYQPLGAIVAVMPWNFPFWQVFRFAAPNVMAGNVGVLKHAANVQGCAEAMQRLFREAGFSEGVFQNLRAPHDRFDAVVADRRVRGVTLTGSVAAGRAVASAAGQHLKPTVLELGGSDPFIVLADADLDQAVALGVQSRVQNNGQSCIAAKRFILEAPIAEAFTERFVRAMEELTVGRPDGRGDRPRPTRARRPPRRGPQPGRARRRRRSRAPHRRPDAGPSPGSTTRRRSSGTCSTGRSPSRRRSAAPSPRSP